MSVHGMAVKDQSAKEEEREEEKNLKQALRTWLRVSTTVYKLGATISFRTVLIPY